MRPKILILGRETDIGKHRSYVAAVRGAGGEPELALPTGGAVRNESALEEFLRPFQGILFPGGPDIEPWRYGEEPHKKLGPTDPELDEGQLVTARIVLSHDIRTLAICRGLQIMGVAVGATLYQDLPSQRPSEDIHNIREPTKCLAHEAIVEEDSLLARLSGSAKFRVNSRHHQAVREGEPAGLIGPFRIVARAPDGIIEGIEVPAHPFCLAVQWHPENLSKDGNPAAEGLFRGFVEVCRTIMPPTVD